MKEKEILLMKLKKDLEQANKFKEYARAVRLSAQIDNLTTLEAEGVEINSMPSNCNECPFSWPGYCDLQGKDYVIWDTGTPPHCFLKELSFEEPKDFVEWLEHYDRWKK